MPGPDGGGAERGGAAPKPHEARQQSRPETPRTGGEASPRTPDAADLAKFNETVDLSDLGKAVDALAADDTPPAVATEQPISNEDARNEIWDKFQRGETTREQREEELQALQAGIDARRSANVASPQVPEVQQTTGSIDQTNPTIQYLGLPGMKQETGTIVVPPSSDSPAGQSQTVEATQPQSSTGETTTQSPPTPEAPADKPAQTQTEAPDHTKMTDEQLLAAETNLQQQLRDGKITQADYHAEMTKLSNQTGAGTSLTEADHPEGYSRYTVENATIHEPTAAERQAGAEVTELTREQQQLKTMGEIGAKLAGIPKGERDKILETLAKNPDALVVVNKVLDTLDLRNANQTQDAEQAAAAEAKKIEAKGDGATKDEIERLRILKILLAILSMALSLAGTVAVATGEAAIAGANALAKK